MDVWTALADLFLALGAGALIGLERTYSGRAAGFRTYALVCVSSAMLLAASSLPREWLAIGARGLLIDDPTRVVQGIMTGIGFLGAGVIVKEGFSVRGLTTAASIWVTAAIGILIGCGLFIPGVVVTLVTLGILSAFGLLESRLPTQRYLHMQVSFAGNAVMSEMALRQLLKEHHFRITEMTYALGPPDDGFTYETVIWTHHEDDVRRLVATLREQAQVRTFRISPSKD
jgi:putative Mg2+ transporter-C (MgtC) family protein